MDYKIFSHGTEVDFGTFSDAFVDFMDLDTCCVTREEYQRYSSAWRTLLDAPLTALWELNNKLPMVAVLLNLRIQGNKVPFKLIAKAARNISDDPAYAKVIAFWESLGDMYLRVRVR